RIKGIGRKTHTQKVKQRTARPLTLLLRLRRFFHEHTNTHSYQDRTANHRKVKPQVRIHQVDAEPPYQQIGRDDVRDVREPDAQTHQQTAFIPALQRYLQQDKKDRADKDAEAQAEKYSLEKGG